MLLGRIPRNAYQVFQTPILARANNTNNRMLARRNRQKIRYEREQQKHEPKRRYSIQPKVFHAGDWVRLRSEKQTGQALQRGVPIKWISKWDEKGVVLGPIPGHPDQYNVRKDKTGITVKWSGKSLSKIPNPTDDEEELQQNEQAQQHQEYELQEIEVNLLN